MHKTPSPFIGGLLPLLMLFGTSANTQDLAVYELNQSVINIDTLGDVKLIRTADTPREVRIIKAREYQASTCVEYTTHESMGTCYDRTLVPNPRVCGLYETFTTYGPFGGIIVQRRCVYWVGGGTSSVATPYSCPVTRQVCARSEFEMRVGTVEFNFELRRMHRLADGEVEEYLLTEQNNAGRTTFDFRILNSNGRRYEVRRNGTNFELRRE